MASAHPVRVNRSFLATSEQRLIRWILPRIPASVRSLDLTIFGLVGSCVAALGLIGCEATAWFYPLIFIGVAMNWFGDSLDGSLARFRQEERPRFGFLVDHTSDLFSQIVIIIAFGLSPFLSLTSALVVLLCYLLFSAYTYIRATVQHVHQMAYIGVGATEFRILMVLWPAIGIAVGLQEPVIGPITKIDAAMLPLGLLAVIGLGLKAVRDAREISADEKSALEAVVTAAPLEAPPEDVQPAHPL